MTNTGPFQAGITGLTPFTTYYFKAKADGGIYGTSYGAEMNFTTNHLPPVVDTGGTTDIMTNAAILNGNLYLLGSAPTVDMSFEWGTTQGGPYTNSTPPQAMTEPEAFQAQLTGLTPDTTYYYRAKGDGGVDGTGHGAEHAFTTSSHPPIVATNDATDITDDSAILNGNLDNLGTATTVNVSFKWGTTHGGPYPNSTTPQAMTATGAFHADINDLSLHTAYYFRAKADGGIYGTSYGAEMSFFTKASPSVTTGSATLVQETTATLNGDLTSLGSYSSVYVFFQYGLTANYGTDTAEQAKTATGAFNENIANLSKGTLYHFRAACRYGSYIYGGDKTFLTKPDSPANFTAIPGDGQVNLSWNKGVGANKTMVRRSTDMFPQTRNEGTQVYFGTGTSYTDAGLTNGTTYYYSAWSEVSNDGLQQFSDGKAKSQARPIGPPVPPVPPVPPSPAQPRSSPTPPRPLNPAQLSLQYLSVNPQQTYANKPVTISTNVVNTGGETGNYTAVLRINGRVEQSRTVSVGPQGTQPVKFTVTKSQPGTYTVDIGGQKSSFVVSGAGSRPSAGMSEGLLFVAAIAVIAILVILLIIVARRRLQGY